MTNTAFTGTGGGKLPLGIGVAPAVVRARGRGRLFALVDLLDRLEREGRRLAAVLSIL